MVFIREVSVQGLLSKAVVVLGGGVGLLSGGGSKCPRSICPGGCYPKTIFDDKSILNI